jgi:hypothetical protein
MVGTVYYAGVDLFLWLEGSITLGRTCFYGWVYYTGADLFLWLERYVTLGRTCFYGWKGLLRWGKLVSIVGRVYYTGMILFLWLGGSITRDGLVSDFVFIHYYVIVFELLLT